ncbi:MAG: S8 family serine peptidase [Acidobacteria bacterium]|nr:S8 family serine peptidase [Acidobacteriota bacterium]
MLTLLVVLGPATAARPNGADHTTVEVIIRAVDGMGDTARSGVALAGGTVGKGISAIGGFVAEVPSGVVERLTHLPGVASVTRNRSIQLFSRRLVGDALVGSNSLDHVRDVVGVDNFLPNGNGVGVALIDTGVAPVPGLDGSNKLRYGPNLSFDPTVSDAYGHGTHMASIIAGDDNSNGSGSFHGVGDNAKVVSVKVADSDGSTDLLRLLAAMQWVIQNKDSSNIRVLNLSFGADPIDYMVDPLAVAVEAVWKAGIVVVVAAGNNGENSPALSSPATDPFVIAVGAADTKGTSSLSDDTVPSFSPKGTEARHVDLVAPGQSILGLRDPGSRIDNLYPSARVGDRLFKGTGTSQAAAVVSGAVADLLTLRPGLTPDQVKWVLKAGARDVPNASDDAQGAGMVDVRNSLLTPVFGSKTQTAAAAGSGALPPAPPPAPPVPASGPSGSNTWSGGNTWTGGSWTGGSWTGGSWTGNSWTGGSWTGGSWTGGSWTGGSWTGGSWTGGSWTGGSWTGGSWTGGSWTGGSWTGASWTGGSWTGGSWTGGSWTGGSWTGGSWTGGSWTGGSWTGGSWTGGSWTGGSWTGGSWTGGSWTGGSWTGGSWTGGSWTGGSWTSDSWTGSTWS